jgi:dTDP-4-dehydrorhamnose reductase
MTEAATTQGILLLGANGQLGRELLRLLAAEQNLHVTSRQANIPGARHHQLDLNDAQALQALLEHLRPGLIINASAYTAVDRAESETDLAHRLNAGVPQQLAEYAFAQQAKLLHFSTDYVFSGEAIGRAWREDDEPEPLGAYGESKRAGELAIQASGCAHLILRTAWVYGLYGHNFLRTMLRLGRERDQLKVVDDQIGAPTWARDLAQLGWLANCHGLEGVYHLTNAGQTSWHGFASEIFAQAEALGLLTAPQVAPIPSSEFPTPAKRPAWSVLDISRLQRDLIITMPSWQASLRRCLEDMAGLGDWLKTD